MPRQSLAEMLKEWAANDYFTPNSKAEVILGPGNGAVMCGTGRPDKNETEVQEPLFT